MVGLDVKMPVAIAPVGLTGMQSADGEIKAARAAEKFGIPVFTFVDTPGAFPGIDAEERNQSEAIGRNLYVQAELEVPIIATIIGEGGSGGALAIALAMASEQASKYRWPKGVKVKNF
jgi:acetyl-CoA carboxylase alpha subunit